MKNIKRHLAIAVLGISLLSCSVEKTGMNLYLTQTTWNNCLGVSYSTITLIYS